MNRYVMMDVFDLHFYDGYDNSGIPLFSIQTMSKISIGRDLSKSGKNNMLYIEDAVVDFELMRAVLGGELDGKEFRIEGKSRWRNLDGVDSDVILHIEVAKIDDYKFTGLHQYSKVSISFELPLWDNHYGKNLQLVTDDEMEKNGWAKSKTKSEEKIEVKSKMDKD